MKFSLVFEVLLLYLLISAGIGFLISVIERLNDKTDNKTRNSFYEQYIKRMLDFIFALSFIIVFWWLYLLIAILVKIKIGSPVLFKHPRPGKNEEVFNVYKFRSMTNDSDKYGNLLPDEDRLTAFGLKLRSTSLDELPEMFLIVSGKMSLVGPRPLEVYFLPYYNETEHHRHDVRPGLTGLAQVSGRNDLTWEEKFEYDLEYVNNVSFLLDFKIVLMTIKKVFSREGVVEEGGATIVDVDVERKKKMMEKEIKENG